jgi:hypothetical protein
MINMGMVRMTASILAGLIGNGAQFRCLSFFKPWNKPQSINILFPAASSRNREPVTVSAAPKNVSFIIYY